MEKIDESGRSYQYYVSHGRFGTGTSLVENYAKKNRSRFPIAVFLTTLIYSHLMTTKNYFSFCDCKFKGLGVFDIPLERYF